MNPTIAAPDHPTDPRPPEPVPEPTTPEQESTPHTWTITTTEGINLTGYQPDWSMDNPSRTGIPLDQAMRRLRSYSHFAMLPAEPIAPLADAALGGPGHWYVVVQIECYPYSEQLQQRIPTANFAIIEEYEVGNLAPADLHRIADQLRAQAALFETTVLPALITAREDWATHHPTTSVSDQSKADIP
ncbi:DUF6907 domain-containing protein [Actinacidiphila sp. bgisy144]|uniref:DUF6907 domain-containing protein n=1 Tax=Actinacidiphila sp. bgisy144 TaxID=3413791 RepID=UPI003EBE2593